MKYMVLTRIMNSAASLAETEEIEFENVPGLAPVLRAYQKASLKWPDRGIEGVWPGEIGESRTRIVNEDKPRIVEGALVYLLERIQIAMERQAEGQEKFIKLFERCAEDVCEVGRALK